MKKFSLIISVLALVLGLAQCAKKPNVPIYGYTAQTITFSNSGNDGQKGLFHEVDKMLDYHWADGDVIYVYATTNEYKSDGTTDFGTSSMYCGVLDDMEKITDTKAKFTGSVNIPNNAKAVRFVHYGKNVTVDNGATTVGYATQTGVIEDVSDNVIAKCDRPYTGNVYEDCNLEVAFAVVKFSFEKFDSDEKVTLTTPGNTQINVAAGGAISYDTQDKIVFNITSSSAKGNNKKEYFAVMMPEKEATTYTFSDGEVKAKVPSAIINKNTYYTKDGAPIIPDLDVYIKPSEMTKTSILTDVTLDGYSSDGFTVSGRTGNGWERIFIPIYNLEKDQWYTITFTEEVTRPASETGYWWCIQGTYSTNVTEVKNEGNGIYSNIPWIACQKPGMFAYVMCLGGWNGNFPYAPTTPKVSTTFQATAETMFWTVDFSQFADGVRYTWKFNLVGDGIKKIEPENTYYADMPNSTMYGYDGVENEDKGLCSFKVYADYHTIDFYSYGANAHEKFNVPLKGLTKDKKYKLTFDYTRERLTGDGSSDFAGGSEFDNCFGISATENQDTGTSNLNGKNGYGDNFTDDHLYGETIEFTATAETMYWVWSQSRLRDGVRFHQVAENITLEQID